MRWIKASENSPNPGYHFVICKNLKDDETFRAVREYKLRREGGIVGYWESAHQIIKWLDETEVDEVAALKAEIERLKAEIKRILQRI